MKRTLTISLVAACLIACQSTTDVNGLNCQYSNGNPAPDWSCAPDKLIVKAPKEQYIQRIITNDYNTAISLAQLRAYEYFTERHGGLARLRTSKGLSSIDHDSKELIIQYVYTPHYTDVTSNKE